jgi:hypothetical protein
LKKVLSLILTLTGIISIGIVANAYHPGPGYPPPPPPHHGPHPDDRMEARRVLNETQEYLNRAERVAYGHLREDLRRAFDLQADARDLYSRWRYRRASQLSLHSREIAQDIIAEAERRDPPPPPPPHHHHEDDDDDRESSIRINLKL